MRGLVAYLYPAHLYPSLPDGQQHLACMVGEGLPQLAIRHLLPCGWYVLLPGIGPPVAVVEINHQGHAPVLGSPGHTHHIFFIAETSMLHWVYPYTQPNGIESQFTHQGCILARLALSIIQLDATGLQLGSTADVCPQPEGLSRHGQTSVKGGQCKC